MSAQLVKTIYIDLRDLDYPSLASSVHNMCARLTMNLVDCIFRIPNGEGNEFYHYLSNVGSCSRCCDASGEPEYLTIHVIPLDGIL